MHFYSTNNASIRVSLEEAVTRGLAPDNGLYMPEKITPLPETFLVGVRDRSFAENAFGVASHLLGGAIPEDELRAIVEHTVSFDAPLHEVQQNIYALELFHGPTMAFKDYGARFMSRVLGYFAKRQEREIIILVATSGDTGSAVANGFLGVAGTRVVVLYPKGKVSEIQEKQFTTLDQNVTALEVDGNFDDCQRLVKQAFVDDELRSKYFLTSANSINIARLIPQSFYFFRAYSQLPLSDMPLVVSVPSGNFGNLTGGLLAQRMGLPIRHFIASTNVNDIVPEYLRTSIFSPRMSTATISNAMDVGNPSNFARMLELFGHDYDALSRAITGYAFSDAETRQAMRDVYRSTGYVLDPHGAIGYLGLSRYLQQMDGGAVGVFLETAHPAKFKETVDATLETDIPIPGKLMEFMKGKKKSVLIGREFDEFKTFLRDSF